MAVQNPWRRTWKRSWKAIVKLKTSRSFDNFPEENYYQRYFWGKNCIFPGETIISDLEIEVCFQMEKKSFQSHAPGHLVDVCVGEYKAVAFVPDTLPPIGLEISETVTTQGLNAAVALGELRGVGLLLPNPGLLITPFMRREALLSSRIEGTQTSTKEVAIFELDGNESPDAHEVSNYVAALNYGLKKVEQGYPISLNVILELHRILMNNVRGKDKSPGRFRTIQNWIGTSHDIRKARFVPPPVSPINYVTTLMDNFEKYLNSGAERHPLLQAALMHYQFEAVHPFLDGNGRLGRLLVVLFLAERKLMPRPLLYLSAFFEKNRDAYTDALLAVSQQGAWEAWIQFFFQGVEEQARDAVTRSQHLVATWNRMREQVTQARSSSLTLSLIDKLFAWPAITIPKAAKLLDVQYPTAKNNIEKLVDAGILVLLEQEKTGGARDYGKVYLCPEIIGVIEQEY